MTVLPLNKWKYVCYTWITMVSTSTHPISSTNVIHVGPKPSTYKTIKFCKIDFHRLTMRPTFICLRKWRTCGPVVSKKNDGMILWCPYSSFTDFLCTFVHVVNSISNRFFQILATEVWMKEIATYFHLFLCYSILLKNLKANTPFSQKLFSKEPFTSTRKGSSSNNTKLQWMEVQSLVTNMLFPKTGSQLSIVTI